MFIITQISRTENQPTHTWPEFFWSRSDNSNRFSASCHNLNSNEEEEENQNTSDQLDRRKRKPNSCCGEDKNGPAGDVEPGEARQEAHDEGGSARLRSGWRRGGFGVVRSPTPLLLHGARQRLSATDREAIASLHRSPAENWDETASRLGLADPGKRQPRRVVELGQPSLSEACNLYLVWTWTPFGFQSGRIGLGSFGPGWQIKYRLTKFCNHD